MDGSGEGWVTAVTVGEGGALYLANPALRMEPLTAAIEAQPGVRHPGRTVLVVDDEEVVRMLVTRALREAGHEVVEASHGAAALALLESGTREFDLVICDLVMPGLNGRELARWLGAHRPDLPILLISGYPLPYLEAHDLYDPGIPLLRKPFLPSRLLETVEESLTPASARSPSST
jgi:CheY-like chemotaxis protein